jgi:hypothetical protein
MAGEASSPPRDGPGGLLTVEGQRWSRLKAAVSKGLELSGGLVLAHRSKRG